MRLCNFLSHIKIDGLSGLKEYRSNKKTITRYIKLPMDILTPTQKESLSGYGGSEMFENIQLSYTKTDGYKRRLRGHRPFEDSITRHINLPKEILTQI